MNQLQVLCTYIEAISDKDANTKLYPATTMTKVQIKPADPPFIREKAVDARTSSHVLMSVQAKPRIEIKRKFRCRTVSF